MSSPSTHRVLVTGSAGRIGKAASQALLDAGHFVRGFDRAASPYASETIAGDIGDLVAIKRAAESIDTIIHLAATPDDEDFMTSLLPNNLAPVHHVLEAARANKARVILASSGQVNWHQQESGPHPIRVDQPLTPRYWYAVTKIFAEYAGRVYSETHGLDVIAVRLGACPRDRAFIEGLKRNEIPQDVYLSPGDAGRFFKKAVEVKGGFGFKIVYVFSKSINRQIFDLEPARQLCGFEPQDRWPEGVPPELAVHLR